MTIGYTCLTIGIFFALTAPFCTGFLFSSQKVRVKGEFFCPTKPSAAANIAITMKDKDTGNIDDTLGRTNTDEYGRFSLEGSGRDAVGDIDPMLYVYHDCNDYTEHGIAVPIPCQRRWKFTIPDKYVDEGTMDLGRINLEIIMDEEEHDCVHNPSG